MDRVCFDASIAYSRRELREYLSVPGAGYIVAEVDGAIAGFIVTVRQADQGYIVTIDVLPKYRRHAIGGALLGEAEKRMVAEGVREVSLETATENASAIAFWQNHGYRTRGVIEGYYPGGRDAYSMSKLLPPVRKQKARS